MKVIEDRKLMPWSDVSFERLLDNDIKYTEISCIACGSRIKIAESYINKMQEQEINYTIDRFNSFMKALDDSILEIYGEDIKSVLLSKKIKELKDEYFKPKLKLMK